MKLLKKFNSFSSLIFLLFLLFLSNYINAQTGSLKGKVIDSETGEELLFVNVRIDGTTIGTATDESGNSVGIGVLQSSGRTVPE